MSQAETPKIQVTILEENGAIEFETRNPAGPDAAVGANYLDLCNRGVIQDITQLKEVKAERRRA
jgi:hypothetical protein